MTREDIGSNPIEPTPFRIQVVVSEQRKKLFLPHLFEGGGHYFFNLYVTNPQPQMPIEQSKPRISVHVFLRKAASICRDLKKIKDEHPDEWEKLPKIIRKNAENIIKATPVKKKI